MIWYLFGYLSSIAVMFYVGYRVGKEEAIHQERSKLILVMPKDEASAKGLMEFVEQQIEIQRLEKQWRDNE